MAKVVNANTDTVSNVKSLHLNLNQGHAGLHDDKHECVL